jgi:hypothetical protein
VISAAWPQIHLGSGFTKAFRRSHASKEADGGFVLLNTPRELSIVHAGQTFRIDRRLALPQPEERMYALGWEDRNVSKPSDRLIFHRDALRSSRTRSGGCQLLHPSRHGISHDPRQLGRRSRRSQNGASAD